MAFHKIASLLEQVKAVRVLLLCHQNADPDALCAAFVFSSLLKRVNQGLMSEIASPEGISRLSKALITRFPIRVSTAKPDFAKADVIFMLDINTVQQLGSWREELMSARAPIVMIDHHANHPETEKMMNICICDEHSSSTCEIVYGFFKELGLKLSVTEAEALFLGIAFDTKHFSTANSNTFKTVGEIVEFGVNAQEALSLMSLPMIISERIARLKAGRRAELIRLNEWIIAFSYVRSYQASAARALVEMGAHVAIVVGQKEDYVQISLRATQEFYKRTGFHLGRDLAMPLGEYLHGMGGGHSTSAGVDGIGDFNIVVKYSMRILKEKLRE